VTQAAPVIHVSLARQCLTLNHGDGTQKTYDVSTAANGAGSKDGSNCTPLGRHRIQVMIGMGCPPGTVFVGRRSTGERYSEELASKHPDRDWILTRVLWLQGLEPGKNRGEGIDSLRRFIYIHGTADEAHIGKPMSHGCIRMRNDEIVELSERVEIGDVVLIED